MEGAVTLDRAAQLLVEEAGLLTPAGGTDDDVGLEALSRVKLEGRGTAERRGARALRREAPRGEHLVELAADAGALKAGGEWSLGRHRGGHPDEPSDEPARAAPVGAHQQSGATVEERLEPARAVI